MDLQSAAQFNVTGSTAVVTGATGVLGGAMARGLAANGCKVALLSRTQEKADRLATEIRADGGDVVGYAADVQDQASMQAVVDDVMKDWGRVDILVNSAGGNEPGATVVGDMTFFDLPAESLRNVVDLNLLGTIMPSQVCGKVMADQKSGCIVNISSMAAMRALTRVVGYSASKSAVDCFTRWLAVHFAREYAPEIRVNAIAPGFFETAQNKFLLRDKDTGNLSERGQTIVDHTPMGRFGAAEELVGTLLWLVSPASQFVTGIVVPVDGGFSAFSGV